MQSLQSSMLSSLILLLSCLHQILAQPGFLSLDCGAVKSYQDSKTGILWEPDDAFIVGGLKANLNYSTSSPTLQALRYFPGNQTKYCYSLPTSPRQRYIVRATFLYGNYDGGNTFPFFQISLNGTSWATVNIKNATLPRFEEIIFLSTGSFIYVCIFKGAAGTPFISTLELRALVSSMYAATYELNAHLKKTVRINFGALSADPIRYPDDPVDRIWESDLTRPNSLAGMADGTVRYNTTAHVDVDKVQDKPPEKVMQTAVIGSKGTLTYRYLLEGFPAYSYASTYFAEIQPLGPTDVRAFTFVLANDTQFQGQVVKLATDVGSLITFEPGYLNVSLPLVVNFAFEKTKDSTLGPILNAMEIYQILPKVFSTSTEEVAVLAIIAAKSPFAVWANESGDPCVPVPWDWVSCSTTSPPRVTGIYLSNKNLTGVIPATISQMTGLQNLWLDNNFLTGSIPDLSQLSNLKSLHLQNNDLGGSVPDMLAGLNNLQYLYLQNNHLTGRIPQSLIDKAKKGLDFQFSGNSNLHAPSSVSSRTITAIVGGVIGGILGTAFATLALYCLYLRCQKRDAPTEQSITKPWVSTTTTSHSVESQTGIVVQEDQIRNYLWAEVVDFTRNFSKKIGEGGFGPVYYGQLPNGKEIAVKVLSADSTQGAREFFNEVSLLSRIHHRMLVSLVGYAEDGKERMLIYEYMENGTLQQHLYGATNQNKILDWVSRLKVALEAAKGLDYLHNGCNPSIIHRDVKSSNILLDKNLNAKVADFGLSKLKSDGNSIISSSVGGTVGYLDPEYYMTQRLTDKSDVYSFGVVLLEIISGCEPLNPELFFPHSNIVQWAREALQKGDVESLVDKAMQHNYQVESLWKVAEIAMISVEPFGYNRPNISEVIKEIQDALDIELRDKKAPVADSGDSSSIPSSAFSSYYIDYPPLTPLESIQISGSLSEPTGR
ncbi:hypothetical protein O6H91_05G033700 [Diphasiastrum complanatum]|uniref:Uncharacterized protein n=2 Tax=Diphasiastrum complanatum TaxID=34168 RepID=A0ACC2DM88_DIPCM|nr:hypothetical protein O6H91_05G033700 [Diphasiastrum complanatum]KAJ7555363.1 hypothetical protein O6H91_05G033700 [Diphasiastrum complanatum]